MDSLIRKNRDQGRKKSTEEKAAVQPLFSRLTERDSLHFLLNSPAAVATRQGKGCYTKNSRGYLQKNTFTGKSFLAGNWFME